MAKKTKKRRRKTEARVDTSAASHPLAVQLEKANQRLTDLEAANRALRAQLKSANPANPTHGDSRSKDQRLLEHLAGALQLAAVAELAHTSTPPDTGPSATGLRDVTRPSPGAATGPARARAHELRRDLRVALTRFAWAAENGWHRQPHQDDDIPRIRCRNRSCGAYDVTVKAWRTIRGGKVIYAEVCSSCGSPYPRADEEGDAA